MLITSTGEIQVERRYYACRHCGLKQIPWDEWAGSGKGHVSAQAARMAVLAGSSWSFDIAAQRLWELCGIRISDETIRRLTESAGERAGVWLRSSDGAIENLQKAEGNVEFYTDGTSVNTRQGWREMRLSVWAKRASGAPVAPSEWDSRSLPRPAARWVSTGIQTSEELGPQWSEMARRLDLGEGFGVSVLADGARWIWKQVAEHLPRSECVVDIFHVSEHLHACGRALHGDHTPQARSWAEERLATVLRAGPMELLRELGQARSMCSSDNARGAIEDLIAYVKPNIDGMWYRDRLKRGLPIGSGMVEGACKTIVGRRLKCNSARWNVANANRLGSLCCLLYADQWASFWVSSAA